MAIVLEEVIDAPATSKRASEVDLTPFATKLKLILVAPAGAKALPVKVGEDRGEGISTVRKHFLAALDGLEKTKEYDPSKVKLTFRSATPGEKGDRFYVKWQPKVEKTKVEANGSV